RGQKSIETDWRTKTLQDAMLGHEALQRMFTILNERVENLEDDLRESKAREAEMIAAHRQEIEDIKYKYTVRIQELEAEISALKVRLTRSEGAAGPISSVKPIRDTPSAPTTQRTLLVWSPGKSFFEPSWELL